MMMMIEDNINRDIKLTTTAAAITITVLLHQQYSFPLAAWQLL